VAKNPTGGKKADPPNQKSTSLEVQAENQENLDSANSEGQKPEPSKLWVDQDGEPTSEEFYKDPGSGEWKKNLMRPTQTHGAIAVDPNANMDRASSVVADASIREIYSPQPSQAGEDPGRVMDAAGLHPGAAARAPGNPSNPMTGGVPHLERNSRPPHPGRPKDDFRTTAERAAAGSRRTPVDGPARIQPPPGAPDLPDASTGGTGDPGPALGSEEFDPDATPPAADPGGGEPPAPSQPAATAGGEKPLFG
jgi:hypothetical protein